MTGLADILGSLPEAERRAALASLSADELTALPYAWEVWARPNQMPPAAFKSGLKRVWAIIAGRGFGKNRTAAETLRSEVEAGNRRSIGLVSPTAETARRDMMKDILELSPQWFKPVHEPSQRRLVWPNGAIGYSISAEEPDRARGLNLDFLWADELCAWANAQETWSNCNLALRVPGPNGNPPAAIVTTTPRRGHKLLKAILADTGTVVTRGSTYDNRANLAPEAIATLARMYANTTLGRQELMGELLEETEGAMWARGMLEKHRVASPPDLKRIVVAIDPAGASHRTSAETGIVAAGISADNGIYILRDGSGRFSPQAWARRAIDIFLELQADRIVAEYNFGAEMVEATIRSVGSRAPLKMVHASRGKQIRAEPIVALYEQGKVHHVGVFSELEDQLCGWCPTESGPSPDRLDALVWACTELMESGPGFKVSPIFDYSQNVNIGDLLALR